VGYVSFLVDTRREQQAIEARAGAVFARIVCGVDGTPEGLEAVRQARRIAAADSRLLIVSVSETHLAVRTGMDAARWAENLRTEAQAALDEAGALAGDARELLVHGRAAETLLHAAADHAATLLAIGSHEHSRTAGALIGSVATRVAHDAPCSVLIARAPDDGERFPRSIVVGVDGSSASFVAAAIARELGERLGSTISYLAARGGTTAGIANERLAEAGIELAYTDAKPVAALVEASRDNDLLVVGSRGLTGLRALGSVSERVAHHAICSLFIVRSAN
jgi:nucleotide-binding universal stress UspA family protein